MEKQKFFAKIYPSPFKLLAVTAVSIFIGEALVMLFFFYVPLPPALETILDPTLLVIMLSPTLYFFVFRPLLHHITERKKVEENLVKERDRTRMYFDTAGVIMAVLDTDGRVSLINKKGCELLGYKESAVIGKDWFENFVPRGEWGVVKDFLEDLKAGVIPQEGFFENPIVTWDGEKRELFWHYTPVIEHGVVTAMLFSGEDITERKRIEKALIDSEMHYRLVHNTAFDGIIIADANDRIVDCNPSAEKIFGYAPGELIGMEIVRLMPEGECRQRHLEGLKMFLATGVSEVQGKVLELDGMRKNGEVFPIELVLSSFTMEGKINFTGTIRDITERKHAEKEKERIQAQLNQAQRIDAIGRLGGGIAHDFNNILTAIRGNAELAMEEIDRKDPMYPRLEEIILSVLHASKLTRQLLLFSRGHPFEVAPLNINSTIENLITMLKRLIGEDIEIIAELEANLWTIEADEGNIEQVLLNLAVNARDAMPKGGKLIIKTENLVLEEQQCRAIPEARCGKNIRLTVSDTGVGIEKDVIGRIFEPFFTTKEPGKGTGLGLSVVYGIVRQHDGGITVESEPGRGATFRIYLPAILISPEKEAAKPAVPPEKLMGGGERILLVEDDPRVRVISKDALIEHGYIVFEASSARDAIEIFDREKREFHLLLSDIVLSDINGVQLAEKLTLLKPGLAVLLTSSHIRDRSDWSIINRQGYRFLQKPYSLADLMKAVKEAQGIPNHE